MAQGRNRRRVDRAPAGAGRAVLRALAAALGSLALASLVGLTGWRLLVESDLLRIRAVRFTGLERASREELVALAPVKVGDNLLTADLEALERAVARHPWVKSAQARPELPPGVEVRVVERTPAALVDLAGLYLVDSEAQVFKRAAAGDGLDLPVITGFSRDDYLKRRADLEPLLAGALALLDSYVREGLGAFGAVSEIHVHPDDGVTLYLGEQATQVRLGVGDLPRKLGRLHRVLGALRDEGRRAEALLLDNRSHPSWVTVRLAGGSSIDPGGSRPPRHEARAKGQPDEAAPERAGGPGGSRPPRHEDGSKERRGRAAPLARR